MDDSLTRLLRRLLQEQHTAALGTVHQGDPQVSMVPFVVVTEAEAPSAAFLIHVSGLSAHTRQMRDHPKVSLMVTMNERALDDNGQPYLPQALPRLTLQATATFIDRQTQDYALGKAAYLARFPVTGPIFELPDFSLVRLRPEAIRFIAGFGSAHSLKPEALRTIARQIASA